MTEEKKVEAVDDVNEVTEEEVMEEKKSFVGKLADFGKKHGKKVGLAALLITAGVIGYKLNHGSDSDYTEINLLPEPEPTDSGDTEIAVEVTEE